MNERGSITPFVLVMFSALLLAAGLVVDGGRTLAARREAFATADQAARAGAQELTDASLRGGALALDPAKATATAQAFLAQTGHQGTVTVVGNAVQVNVSVTQRMTILSIAGITQRSISGHAEATAVRGLTDREVPTSLPPRPPVVPFQPKPPVTTAPPTTSPPGRVI